MKKSSHHSFKHFVALTALACALAPLNARTQAVSGTESLKWTVLDDKAPSLPLSATFEKGKDPEVGPYILVLKNDSKDSLMVSASVHLSVAFHANKKDREYPSHTLGAGQTWNIPDLAAGDKVTLTADGYSPLELTVP